MKKPFKISLLTLAALPARAQVTSLNVTSATNLPSVITAGASSNSLTSWVPIRQNSGIAFDWAIWGTGTSNAAFQVTPSIDGTNKSSNTNWWFIGANAGPTTTNHITGTLTRDAINGYNFLCITALTNQNNGTITNGGLNASKWPAPLSY